MVRGILKYNEGGVRWVRGEKSRGGRGGEEGGVGDERGLGCFGGLE